MKALEVVLIGLSVTLARVVLTIRAARINAETRRFLARRGRRVISEI